MSASSPFTPRIKPHFRTSQRNYRLPAALLLSLLLHLAPLLPALIAPTPPPVLPPLQARLRPPPAALPLIAPEPAPEQTPPVRKMLGPPAKTTAPAASWQNEIRRQFKKQQEQGQYYPQAAIALGLQGEAQVLLIVDTDGQVVAARIEQGSGHVLLDEAALRAVRALHSLPADTPREAILPVRFRLR